MSDEFFARDSRQPGHFWADNEVLDIYGPLLGAHGFAVYMALTRNATNGTGECKLSTSKLAAQLGMSKGGVFNALGLLVKLNLAKRIHAGDPRHPAIYVLADVKALVNPTYAQLRLAPSVHPVNAGSTPSVHPVNASGHGVNAKGHPVNAAFIPRTRNKEVKTSLQDLQDCKTKSEAFDPDSSEHVKKGNSISSSTNHDDDIEVNPPDLARVLKAYQESPVTTGKVGAADTETACAWLGGRPLAGRRDLDFTPYTAEQIENGIVLATARRLCTESNADILRSAIPPVRSLQYFQDAIREAMSDRNMTEGYLQNCRRMIGRENKKREARAQ